MDEMNSTPNNAGQVVQQPPLGPNKEQLDILNKIKNIIELANESQKEAAGKPKTDTMRNTQNDILKSVYEQQGKAETKNTVLLAFNGAAISAVLKYYTTIRQSIIDEITKKLAGALEALEKVLPSESPKAVVSKLIPCAASSCCTTLLTVIVVIGTALLFLSVVASAISFFPNLSQTPYSKPTGNGGNPATNKSSGDETYKPEKVSFITDLKKCFSRTANEQLGDKPPDIHEDSDPIMSFIAARKFDCGKDYLSKLGESFYINPNDICIYDKHLSRQVVHNSKIVDRKYACFRLAIRFSVFGLGMVLFSFILFLLK